MRELLLRHRADRYPEEHATLQFHLGATLLECDRVPAALQALRTCAELFEQQGRELEQAKAHNLLGATRLHLDDVDGAAEELRLAAGTFERLGQPLEHAATRFNLGLVLRRRGEAEPAMGCFAEALTTFEQAGALPQASAAARELGGSQLELDDPGAAAQSLEHGLELAKATGERVHVGTVANLLGLARLGTEEPVAAEEALRLAASAHPRQLDPEQHAMVTANLALAHERLGAVSRARLAAWRALQIPNAAPAVCAQARAVLDRLGPPTRDLIEVLDQHGSSEDWTEEVGPSLTALLDADEHERQRLLGHWIDGQLASPLDGTEVGATLCAVLLELPGEQMTVLVRSLLTALQDREPEVADGFRRQMQRAMARFHLPQWQRLQTIFERLAREVGDPGGWS